MAGTPENGAPPGWFTALAEQQMAQTQYLQNQLFGVGQAGGAAVITPGAIQWVLRGALGGALAEFYQPHTPALSVAEFAEEYYEQCFGTPLTPQQRAERLLFEHLTEDEQNEWREKKTLTVTAKSGRRYWITGVDCGRFDDGHTFCVYVGMNECPAEDRVLGLKLAIEADEAQFLKTAVDRGAPIIQGQVPFDRRPMQRGLYTWVNECFARMWRPGDVA